jgi:tetratricopeptide (TPR) repeat protein
MPSRWSIVLVLVAATLAAYANSLSGVFLFDDGAVILQNPAVTTLQPLREYLSQSRGLVTLSFALNYAAGGASPWGYHLVNLGIHLAAGLVLFTLLERTLSAHQQGRLLAGAIALLWLVHPLQTESVTYVVQRAESLTALCYLVTLLAAVRHAEPPRGPWGVLAVLACAIGMSGKQVMVTAPIAVLLYDRSFLAGSFTVALRRRWGLYLGLAASWLWLWDLLGSGRMLTDRSTTSSAGFGFLPLTPIEYARSQPAVILHYLRLSLWPDPLCLDYGWPAPSWGEAAPSLLALGALLAATGWAFWRRPPIGFAGAFFFLVLAPTSSVMPLADLAVEHRMYLPLAAVLALVVVGAWRLGRTRIGPRGFAAGTLVLALVAGSLTAQRNRDYQDAKRMWQSVLEVRPHNPRAQMNLAGEQRRFVPEFGDDVTGLYNQARRLERQGDLAAAAERYQRALELKPDFAEAHNNLGALQARRGELADAIAHLREALRLRPDSDVAQQNLERALATQKRLEGAPR